MPGLLGLAALGVLCAAVAGCGGGPAMSSPSRATTAKPGAGKLASNERRLTRAESLRLVAWARTFRACASRAGVELGPLEKHETRMEMRLVGSLAVPQIISRTTACGEQQGGPPRESSLQYRSGRILLYLPKQCLLDAKVAAS